MKGWGSLSAGIVSIAAGLVLFPSVASAQPEQVEESDTVDDATITLRVRDAAIIDDPLVWCEVEIDVVGTAVNFTAGDTVLVEFVEDDLFANDILWSTMHTITQQEADAQAYSEVFDCSAPLMADGIGDLEFFAEAEVVKDLCGLGCVYDRPTTSNVNVEGLNDDEFEEDDQRADAPNSVDGVPEERIARDEDWVRITLQETGDIDADFEYMTVCGGIDAILVNEDDEMVAEIEPGDDAGVVSATGLPAGVYFLQIQPEDPGDFNFYDLTIDTTLTPGATTGDGTGGDDSSDSASDSASSDSASDSASSDSASDSASGGSASDSAGSAGSAGSGSGGEDTDDATAGSVTDDEGCGCRHRGDSPPAAWMLLGLLALAGRPRE